MSGKIFKTIKRKLQLFSRENAAGFTLIETVMAIGVISVGFVGSMVLLSKASSQATAIKDRVVAAHLAAEGVEVIRNIRDSNFIQREQGQGQGQGLEKRWLDGLIKNNKDEATGVVDYNSDKIDEDGASDIDDQGACLNWHESFYTHAIGPDLCNTFFSRLIELKIVDDNELNTEYLEVKSKVQWKEKGISKSLEVIDNLYDWK